jgi:hypothetical protein
MSWMDGACLRSARCGAGLELLIDRREKRARNLEKCQHAQQNANVNHGFSLASGCVTFTTALLLARAWCSCTPQSACIGALAPPIAFVALSGFGDILGLRAAVCGKRTADVVTLLKFPLRVPTDIAFVAFMRLYDFAFRSHWMISCDMQLTSSLRLPSSGGGTEDWGMSTLNTFMLPSVCRKARKVPTTQKRYIGAGHRCPNCTPSAPSSTTSKRKSTTSLATAKRSTTRWSASRHRATRRHR